MQTINSSELTTPGEQLTELLHGEEATSSSAVWQNLGAGLPGIFKQIGFWLAMVGPGLMVMLADTDAGSIITAAQSGAQWGYSMILPQLLLIPILYVVQEMTVRLGIVTGKG